MKTLFLACILITGSAMAAESDPLKIAEVITNVSPRSRVFIQGRIDKQINFDTMVLNDGTGSLVIDLASVRHALNLGDEVAVFGRYRGTSSYRAYNGEVQVMDLAKLDDAEAIKKMGEKFAKQRPILKDDRPKTIPETAPKIDKTVELRLEELEKLKSKNLVSPEEYQEQRKRILNDL